MKALLFAVVIILVILFLIVLFLNKKTKKIVLPIKETFYTDDYDLQMGESQYETISILERDVKNVKIEQENNTIEFSSLKNDTTKQLNHINTDISQYQLDARSKIATLQETTDAHNISINTINNNLNDYSNKFKSFNDDFSVIDGRLIAITKNQEQLNGLKTNVDNLSAQQYTFGDLIDKKNKSVINDVNSRYDLLQNNFNTSVTQQEKLLNTTTGQLNTLSIDLGNLKTNNININNSLTTRINSINSQTLLLNNIIDATKIRIIDVASQFKDYIKQDQLGKFILKTDMNAYATLVDQEKYATKGDISGYISAQELKNYIPRSEVKNIIDMLNTATTNMSTLQNTINSIPNTYVKLSDFNEQAKKATDSVSLHDNIQTTNTKLEALYTTTGLDKANYATKDDLAKASLSGANNGSAITSSLAANKTTIDNITNQINDIKKNYMQTKDVGSAAIIATNSDTLKMQLATSITDIITLKKQFTDLNGQFVSYYTKTDVDNKLKLYDAQNNTFATTAKLNDYVLQSDLTLKLAAINKQIGTINTGTANILDTLTVNKNIHIGTNDPNSGLDIFTNNKDGADRSGGDGYQGGLESWWGIGFRNKMDKKTRFMHDTRTGDTLISGKLDVNGDGKFASVGRDNADWFSIYGANKGTAVYNGMSINDGGGLSVGSWNKAPQGTINTNDLHVQNNIRIEQKGLSMGGTGQLSVDSPDTVGGRLIVDNDGTVLHNNIKFSKKWSAYTDNSNNKSEISNDTDAYKSLMIVGNKSGGGERRVGIWDTLNVNGALNVSNNTNTNTVQISNKWRLGDTGDDWLRLNKINDSSSKGYYGGLAAGRLWSAEGALAGSDIRMKNNISLINKDDSSKLLLLDPKKYKFTDDITNRERYGFIAQDVEKIYPNIVTTGANNMKGLNYDDIIPLTVANIKDIKQNLPNQNTLCLGDVCITKEDLKALKEKVKY